MKTSTHPKLVLASSLFVIGIFFGLTLSVMATWGDFEAAFYGFSRRASTPLKGLNCPVLMTQGESRTVSLELTNRTDQPISPSVRTDISTPLEPASGTEALHLAPGESGRLEWTIGPGNIDLGQFIFVKVLVYAAHPLPDRENTCGVLVLPVRGDGTLIFVLGAIVSILSLASGTYLLQKSNLRLNQKRAGMFLAIIIVFALGISFLGLWIPAILLLTVAILMIVIVAGMMLNQNTQE
jgi:hypothetical protein